MPRKIITKPDKLGRMAPVERLFDTITPEKFMTALETAAMANGEPRFKKFRDYLLYKGDPRKPISFLTACKVCDISFRDMMDLMNDHRHMETVMQAMMAAPQVMADIGEDARSKDEGCPRCDGLGEVENGKDKPARVCPLCEGSGKIRKQGDSEARKMLLEVGGFTKKSPAVAIQQNFGQPNTLERTIGYVQKALK